MTRPYEPRLLDALEELRTGAWKANLWRQTIGTSDPLVPNARGARWNPPGVDTLYCALTASGAQAELASMIARQPIAITKSLRMYRLSVQLSSVVDLREAGQLSGHGYTADIMTAEDWGPPQRLGGAAAWLGIGGLIVPSVRHPDGNLAIFVNNLGADDLVEVLHAGE